MCQLRYFTNESLKYFLRTIKLSGTNGPMVRYILAPAVWIVVTQPVELVLVPDVLK